MIALALLAASDAAALAVIYHAAFGQDDWDAAALAAISSERWGLVLRQTAPLGFVLCQQVAEDAEILALAVAPASQGRGYGRLLLQAAYDEAKRRGSTALFLEVAEDNAIARRLYERFGFALIGRRPGYYRRAQGAVAAMLMRHNITAR